MAHVSDLSIQSAGFVALNELCAQGIIKLYATKAAVTNKDVVFEGAKGYRSTVFTVDARLCVGEMPIKRIEVYSRSIDGSVLDVDPFYPEVAYIGFNERFSYEWRRAVWPKPYWFDESKPDSTDKVGWSDLRQKVTRLHGKLQKKPIEKKTRISALHPSSILNAFLEGDISHAEAVGYFERWRKTFKLS